VDDLGHEFLRKLKDASYVFVYVDVSRDVLESLRGTLDVLRLYTNAPVVIGDAPERGAMKAFQAAGLEEIPNLYSNVHLLDLTKDEVVEQDFVRADGGGLHIRRAKTAVQAPFRMALGSVADWGLGTWVVPSRETSQGRSWSKGPFIEALSLLERERLLAFLFRSYPCHASLRDGILSGQGFLASLDPVAVDTIMSTIAGQDAHEISHLEDLAQDSQWTNEISEIDVPPAVLQELLSGNP
jgi:hypothetical protein